MKKTKKLRKQIAKELSKNPAQQDYIKEILKLYFNHATDLEDVANLYAALYKVANWIKDNHEGYIEIERSLTEALNDWEPEVKNQIPKSQEMDPFANDGKYDFTHKEE